MGKIVIAPLLTWEANLVFSEPHENLLFAILAPGIPELKPLPKLAFFPLDDRFPSFGW